MTTVVTTRPKKILLIGADGYIGSYLFSVLRKSGYSVHGCDCGLRKISSGTPLAHPYPHQDIYNEELQDYDTVLFFAGTSNVRAAEANPIGALEGNCTDLYVLRQLLRPDARLIYASSGSLYSLPWNAHPNALPPWAREKDATGPGLNAYDRSKACFDAINIGFLENTTGLRLGTVCGYSPNLRPELIFNAMCLSAMQEGVVKIANPLSWRSLVFLEELSQIVISCIDSVYLPKILNVATRSCTVEWLGYKIAKHFNVKEMRLPDSPTYNFRMDTSLLHETVPLHVYTNNSLTEHCDMFARWATKGA